jgi:hypothetical protein
MKKKLLFAVGVLLLAALAPIALSALPIRVGAGTPTVLEACVGGTEPTGITLISFANHTSNAVTITSSQLPGIITPVSIPSNGTVTFQIPALRTGS